MGAHAAQRALPEGVAAALRHAFADEVGSRLPHLRAPVQDVELARLDVHTLASSAVVVGEGPLGTLARRVEDQLSEGQVTPDLAALVTALEGFCP